MNLDSNKSSKAFRLIFSLVAFMTFSCDTIHQNLKISIAALPEKVNPLQIPQAIDSCRKAVGMVREIYSFNNAFIYPMAKAIPACQGASQFINGV
jgi:hypothetical protein